MIKDNQNLLIEAILEDSPSEDLDYISKRITSIQNRLNKKEAELEKLAE